MKLKISKKELRKIANDPEKLAKFCKKCKKKGQLKEAIEYLNKLYKQEIKKIILRENNFIVLQKCLYSVNAFKASQIGKIKHQEMNLLLLGDSSKDCMEKQLCNLLEGYQIFFEDD